jgi:nicotinate-nucleotide pyrophosphorylase (carboxylating)
MNLPTLDSASLKSVVARALDEDLGPAGDLTTAAVIPEDAVADGHFVARQDLVVAGIVVAREVFAQLDPSLELTAIREEGVLAVRGDDLATVRGPARSILEGERTALNFMMRMSGIATMARAAVDEVEGTGATILDTRKTAPGLRALDKYAVAAGGAVNHRAGLFDAVMIKDTHLAVFPHLPDAVRRTVATGLAPERITAEVRTLEQLEQAIEAGAGRALLDNMDLETLREAVRRAKGRIILEASGGLAPGRLRAVAETGVDCLSLGALTHSVRAADIALEIEQKS